MFGAYSTDLRSRVLAAMEAGEGATSIIGACILPKSGG